MSERKEGAEEPWCQEECTAALVQLGSHELLERVIAEGWLMKVVGSIFEARPPDSATAGALLDVFAAGRLEPFFTAYLLGCLREPMSLPTLREIMVSAPGSCAESYAAHAMVKSDRHRARGELLELLEEPHHFRCRMAARHGLIKLQDATLTPELLARVHDGRISSRTATAIIGAEGGTFGLSSAELVTWLESPDASERSIALRLMEAGPWDSQRPTPDVVAAIKTAFARDHDLPSYLQARLRLRT